jgi:hypothetical protein
MSHITVLLILKVGGGLLLLLGLFSLWRVLYGFRLNLYLLNHDSLVQDQTIIPITSTARKQSIGQTLFSGSWREDIEITLTDHKNRSYYLSIGYHPWRRFYLNVPEATEISLNKLPLEAKVSYAIRNGMQLKVNDRDFEVLVTHKKMFSQFPNEFKL